MSTSPITNAILEIADKIALFENPEDLDRFLEDSLAIIKDKTDVNMGALYFREPDEKNLILQAAFDRDGFWGHNRIGSIPSPSRFELVDAEVDRVFDDRQVLEISYDKADAKQPYLSKMIIPVSRGQNNAGILILGRTTGVGFHDRDDAGLLSAISEMSERLEDAGLIIESQAENPDKPPHRIITGKKASNGSVEGSALPFWADMESAALKVAASGDIPYELSRFNQALSLSLKQLDDLLGKAKSEHVEMVSMIFSAHLMMLKDPNFTDKMIERIGKGESAAHAVRSVANEYADIFSDMKDLRLAEKAQDVRDLGYRLVTNLADTAGDSFSYQGKIALAGHIFPSDLFRLAVEGVAGLVLRGSGVTAHISILARSLNLPVLITDDKALLDIPEGSHLLLDASGGRLYINPDDEVLEKHRAALRNVENPTLNAYHIKGRTADGIAVQVLANVNIRKDADEAIVQGAEGIGLYRSEFPFILKNDYLSEEQQYRIYKSIIEGQDGKPVVLRTADIGGDKLLHGREDAESNPFLGVRGIRFSLANREMFREQLRAMLRAGEGADLGIMLPMVSGVEEVLEAKEEIRLCLNQLAEQKIPHNPKPRIGAMIELPSAALSVGDLASVTDFLSIGTNDLTMYLLAVDRTNEKLSHLYSSHHPTVLRVLSAIAQYAGKKRSELSVCGDVASDPVLIPFFVGIGIRKLSVSPSLVETVKRRLSSFTVKDAKTISREILGIKRLSEMEGYLKTFDKRHPGVLS